MAAPFKPITPPSTDLNEILEVERKLQAPHFNSHDVVTLGLALHARLQHASKPALISILAPSGLPAPSSPHRILFQASSGAPGVTPDNDHWVARKGATVFRFGTSSWYMGQKLKGDEMLFAHKYGLSPETASHYAIHGGAVPLRVHGVEFPVAAVIVSGLSQAEDHGVVVEVLQEWLSSL